MVTYEQAAVIIPREDLQKFFGRYGYRLTAVAPSHVAKCMRDVIKRAGTPALDDLQSVCKTSLKAMSGCGCSGDCGGCSEKKFNAAGDAEVVVTETTVVKQENPIMAFAKKHEKALVAGAIIIAAIYILKKL